MLLGEVERLDHLEDQRLKRIQQLENALADKAAVCAELLKACCELDRGAHLHNQHGMHASTHGAGVSSHRAAKVHGITDGNHGMHTSDFWLQQGPSHGASPTKGSVDTYVASSHGAIVA